MVSDAVLARAVTELADTHDAAATLRVLTQQLVAVVGAHDASVILASPYDRPQLAAASTEAARQLGLAELRAGDGPGLESLRIGQPVGCLVDERTRWRRFAAAAGTGGYTAVLTLPIKRQRDTIGAVNLLYASPQRGDIPMLAEATAAQALVVVAADKIAHMMAGDREIGHPQTAPDRRVVIEQAQGILASPGRMSTDEAFTVLRAYARTHNQKLHTVAHAVVQGDLGLVDTGPEARSPGAIRWSG